MARLALGRVAYAILGFAEDSLAPRDFPNALRESLRPGTNVERYGKRWYMAQHHDSGDRWIEGRLAFEAAGEETGGIWDDQTKDIRMIDSLGRPVQPLDYVIDVPSRRVAFELRAQHIRPWTFQGNFQALLQRASNLPWRVELEGVQQPPWEEWQKRVSRITAIWLTMKPPNPHSPREEIQEMFDKAKVSAATLAVQGEDVGLTDSEFLEASFAHAIEYGQVTAKGVAPTAGKQEQEEWSTKAEAGVRKDAAPRDPATRRVSVKQLRSLLKRRAKADDEKEEA